MASLVLKPMKPNLDLIPKLIVISTFTTNVILINQYVIFWSTYLRVEGLKKQFLSNSEYQLPTWPTSDHRAT